MSTLDCLNLQPEFEPAVLLIRQQVIDYFGDRLAAIYFGGSIAIGDALAGVSDLDWWMFIDGEPGEADLAWCETLRETVATRYPQIAEYHPTPYPVAKLEQDAFWRYALRHTAMQLYGRDILGELEARGIAIDAPSRAMAIKRLGWAKPLLDHLRAGVIPDYLYKAPEIPCLAIRKLARYFVIVEGAYLLMAEEKFASFRASEVLPALRAHFPQWQKLYNMTAEVLADPYSITFTEETYRGELIPFFAATIKHVEGLAAGAQ